MGQHDARAKPKRSAGDDRWRGCMSGEGAQRREADGGQPFFSTTEVRGFVGSWVRGFVGSWVRGFVGSGFVGSRGFEGSGHSLRPNSLHPGLSPCSGLGRATSGLGSRNGSQMGRKWVANGAQMGTAPASASWMSHVAGRVTWLGESRGWARLE
eukprot:4086225-Prymnesium_polylepis.1